MANDTFQCRRGIYLLGLSHEYVQAQIDDYQIYESKTPTVSFAVSKMCGGWLLVGVSEGVSRDDFHNLALSFFGTGEDDDEASSEAAELPAENVIVVAHVPGLPEKTYYALLEDDNEEEDIFLRGRRDDGKGVRISVLDNEVKLLKKAKGYTMSVVDYLRGRGVPEELLPGPHGIEFVAAQVTEVTADSIEGGEEREMGE